MAEAAEPSTDTPRAKGPRFTRLLCVWAFCLVVGVGVQFLPINDNSVRNAVSLAAFGAAVVAAAVWVFRVTARRTSPLWAALLTLALLASPAAFFRLRGFTGEIVPLVEYRFARGRDLPSVVRRDASSEADRVGDSGLPMQLAASDFPQFLGPSRNAVLAQREFAVPTGDAKVQWRQPIGDGWAGFAVAGDRCVTLEQRGGEECVTCYRVSDGDLLWMHCETARHESAFGGIGPRSTPTIADGRVYTQGAVGSVCCFDLAGGELIWQQNLIDLAGWTQKDSEGPIAWGRAGSPLIVDDLCILPFGGPDDWAAKGDFAGRSLIAFSTDDGSIRWTAGGDQISYASPMRMTLAGVDQIVSVNERTVTGHTIDDGTVLWQADWKGESNGRANCAAALPVDENAFLVGKAYGTGSAVMEITREQDDLQVSSRWRESRVLKTKFTHACIRDGFAYGLSDGTFECVDLSDGRRVWAQSRGSRYGHGQVLLVDDVLVVQTESGEIAFVAARPDRFEELATLPGLSGKTWNVPTISGRTLLVRNDSEAACYRLPQAPTPSVDDDPQPQEDEEPPDDEQNAPGDRVAVTK